MMLMDYIHLPEDIGNKQAAWVDLQFQYLRIFKMMLSDIIGLILG